MSAPSPVWIPPSATSFSCLCEACLETARTEGTLFAEAIRIASVRGHLPTDSDIGFVACAAGHELVVRRIDRPPGLVHEDERQLRLVDWRRLDGAGAREAAVPALPAPEQR